MLVGGSIISQHAYPTLSPPPNESFHLSESELAISLISTFYLLLDNSNPYDGLWSL